MRKTGSKASDAIFPTEMTTVSRHTATYPTTLSTSSSVGCNGPVGNWAGPCWTPGRRTPILRRPRLYEHPRGMVQPTDDAPGERNSPGSQLSRPAFKPCTAVGAVRQPSQQRGAEPQPGDQDVKAIRPRMSGLQRRGRRYLRGVMLHETHRLS